MGTTNFDTVAAALVGNVTGNLTGQVTAFPVTARTATACLLYTSPSPRD